MSVPFCPDYIGTSRSVYRQSLPDETLQGFIGRAPTMPSALTQRCPLENEVIKKEKL